MTPSDNSDDKQCDGKTGDTPGLSLLENAYALDSPDNVARYYAAMADTYDQDFARELGYAYPAAIARAWLQQGLGQDTPVADIGCGTGLVASALGLAREQIDGFDICAEMLAIARAKNVYRRLYRVDLTDTAAPLPGEYGAVISAGAFTHGHLGPEPLERLLDMARPGALFVVGVNRGHYAAQGFQSLFDRLADMGRINSLQCIEAPIYDRAGHTHSNDSAQIMVYRKGQP